MLNNAQTAHLQKVLAAAFSEVEVITVDCSETKEDDTSNRKIEELFIAAKKVEGCSEKSLKYYASTIRTMLDKIGKQVLEITTDDLRAYLTGVSGFSEYSPHPCIPEYRNELQG